MRGDFQICERNVTRFASFVAVSTHDERRINGLSLQFDNSLQAK